MEKNKKSYKILLDVEKNQLKQVNASSVEHYYKLICCRVIDIVVRKIGGKDFSIICDDESLFVSNPKFSAIDEDGHGMLVGNLLLAGLPDEEGNLTSLTDEDFEHLLKHVVFAAEEDGNFHIAFGNVSFL